MHEGTLIRELVGKVNEVATQEGATRVLRVNVKVGDLSHASPDHLRQHFDFETSGTISEGAILQVEPVSGADDPLSLEIMIDSIELALAEPADQPAHDG